MQANPTRMRQVNEEVQAMGVRVTHQWALLGQYDFCTVIEAPDEKVMAKVALALGARGTMKTLTLTAIPAEELISLLNT